MNHWAVSNYGVSPTFCQPIFVAQVGDPDEFSTDSKGLKASQVKAWAEVQRPPR
jgi:hypothetical protein